MKGTAKSKAVTSGRLTGGVNVQPPRRRVTPAPAACPEPAYSLYSTDSEDQVASLHKGLDRCAALLGGILQAERAEASPNTPRAVKARGAKSRPSISLGRKMIKKRPTRAELKASPSVQRGASSTPPAAHSGVKLHPPQRRPHTLLQSHASPSHSLKALPHLSNTPPPPQPSILPPQPSTPPPQPTGEEDEEQELVPVRDISSRSSAAVTHTAVEHTHTQLQPGQADTHSSTGTEVRVKTVQHLLRELRAVIAGQGSVAETLLSHLDQTLSSPLTVGSSNIPTDPDLLSVQSQSRHVRTLKKREKTERQENMETPCTSEALPLRQQLLTAQLQEVQDELTELRKALQDTQSQLRDTEAKNALLMTDLETTRRRLLDSEREKSELAALAQKRLEELGHLNRTLWPRGSSVVGSSVSNVLPTQQLAELQQDAAEPPSARVAQYLRSLGQLQPPHSEHVPGAPERDGNIPLTSVQLRHDARPAETSADPQNPPPGSDEAQACVRLLEKERRRLFDSTVSRCDVGSVVSDWSVRSGSTFDTRDEAAFRDGLAALDASISSLQRTLQLDLGR